MAHNIIIGFDLDGTLIDHSDAKIEFAKAHHITLEKHKTPSDVMKQYFPKELVREMQFYIYDHPLGGTQQQLMEGTRETLVFLRKKNIPFFFVSRRRSEASKKNALTILRNNGVLGALIEESAIFFIPTIEEKADVAREKNITHFLDDEVNALHAMTSVTHRFFFDQFNVFEKEFPFPRITKRVDKITTHFL